jgi:hypothetical protein
MTIQEFEAVAAPQDFRPFTIVTKAGWSIEVPHSIFVNIPRRSRPSFVIVYTRANALRRRWINLVEIDHIEYKKSRAL